MTTKQLSETELINRTRLDLFSGPGTTRLVATIAERKRSQSRKRRTVAVVADTSGQGAHVTVSVRQLVQPPADFAEAVAEVDNQPPVCEWRDHDAIDNEVIGEEFSRTPFLY